MNLSDKELRKKIGRTCACFNLRRAARVVTQRFDQVFRDTLITANQFSILMASYNQEGITLTKLAKALGMERTTLSRNLLLLERKGLVTIATGGDRRQRRIKITQDGCTLLEKSLPLWQRAQDQVIEAVGQEQWESLLAGLHKVARSL